MTDVQSSHSLQARDDLTETAKRAKVRAEVREAKARAESEGGGSLILQRPSEDWLLMEQLQAACDALGVLRGECLRVSKPGEQTENERRTANG